MERQIQRAFEYLVKRYTPEQLAGCLPLIAYTILIHIVLLFVWALWGLGVGMGAVGNGLWIWQLMGAYMLHEFVKQEEFKLAIKCAEHRDSVRAGKKPEYELSTMFARPDHRPK